MKIVDTYWYTDDDGFDIACAVFDDGHTEERKLLKGDTIKWMYSEDGIIKEREDKR